MDPATALLIAGAVSSAGAIYQNQQNLKNTNQWNDVQIDLANTAHQREVLDLKAAGLNPILSASGAGAPVPSLGTVQQENIGQGLSDGISSAAKYLSDEYKANVDSLRANTSLVNKESSALDVKEDILNNDRVVSDYSTALELENIWNDKIDTAARREALSGVKPDKDLFSGRKPTKAYKALVEMYKRQPEKAAYEAHWGRSMIQDANNLGDLVTSGVSSARGYKDIQRASKDLRRKGIRVRKVKKMKGGAIYEKTQDF